MKIILIEDVENLGRRGNVLSVADGYARNYLIPKKWAMTATEGNLRFVENQKAAWLRQEAKLKEDATAQAKMLEAMEVRLARKVGEGDALYGSVTSIDIGECFEQQGYNIDRRKIRLERPIKHLGEYTVPIRLHTEVTANIRVVVEREGEVAGS